MDQKKRQELIGRYKDGYRAVAEALVGMTEQEATTHPAPGKWSPREIVHHLAESEMTSAIRLRRLLAEDNPVIHGYDQEAFARVLFYDRPHEASLGAFKAARDTTAEILDRMTEEQWSRKGRHSETGHYGTMRWLEIYADHAHNHAEQILRARAAARTTPPEAPVHQSA